jgi:hypothetical protein
MKLLFTGLLVAASGAVSAHTGDHQGLWQDHGQMAQSIALVAMTLGLLAAVARSRYNDISKQKVTIKNDLKSNSTD